MLFGAITANFGNFTSKSRTSMWNTADLGTTAAICKCYMCYRAPLRQMLVLRLLKFYVHVLQSATTADSGNYTCAPANAKTDSVFLNVVKGMKLLHICSIIKV